MEVQVLGPVRAEGVEAPLGGPRQRALLALLALARGRAVDPGHLAEELWNGAPPASAATTLRSYVSRLRGLLGAGAIEFGGAGYRLTWPTDADRFERVLASGDARGALAVWRGSVAADVAAGLGPQPEAQRLQELRLGALEARAAADLAAGGGPALVAELEALVAQEPLREGLWAVLMEALYRDGRQADALGAYRRAREALDELGLEPGPRLRELEHAILTHSLTAPAAHHLPAALTRFIGREAELTDVAARLRDARLVTLTGPGGAGKTRLAVEAAERALPDAPDGAWFVDLAQLPAGEGVPGAVATTLGVDEGGLSTRLAAARLLLVLDNCEHVLESAAAFAEHLLPRARGCRVLATSRRPLGVAGEVVVAVPALPTGEAVELFLERARRPVDRGAAERICSELEGLPLAVELAAARLDAMTATELEQRLGDRFRLLGHAGRTGGRQSTLRATMDWSYDLLAPREREVLCALSVFAGGFDLEAAEAVTGDTGETVASLVEASLVVAGERAGRSRYRLLETVRQYAAQRLADAGVPRALAAHCLDRAEQLLRERDGPGEAAALARLDGEVPNLRAAVDWALGADAGLAPRLARASADLFRRHGLIDEGRDMSERALALVPEEPSLLRADLLGAIGDFAVRRGEHAHAQACLLAAIAMTRELGEHRAEGRWLHYLAYSWRLLGRYDRCRPLLESAIAAKLTAGDPGGAAWSRGQLGDIATYEGRLDDAEAEFAAGLELIRRAGEPPTVVAAYRESVSQLARLQGDVERTARLAEEGLARAVAIGDQAHIGLNLEHLGWVALRRDDAERAHALAEAALEQARRLGHTAGMAQALELLAQVEVARGRFGRAATLLSSAAGTRERHGDPLPPSHAPAVEATAAAIAAAGPPGSDPRPLHQG